MRYTARAQSSLGTGMSFAWGRPEGLISWQGDPRVLVVEALEGLHDEAPKTLASRTGKAEMQALT